jgi:hypothetical protein
MNERDHQLHRHRRRHKTQARPSDRALLVQAAVLLAVRRGHDVVAEVAAQLARCRGVSVLSFMGVTMLLLCRWLVCVLARRLLLQPVPHNQEGVKAQRRVDQQLAVKGAQRCREPPIINRPTRSPPEIRAKVRLYETEKVTHLASRLSVSAKHTSCLRTSSSRRRYWASSSLTVSPACPSTSSENTHYRNFQHNPQITIVGACYPPADVLAVRCSGWPGIGMLSTTPSLRTPGKIFLSRAAAAVDLNALASQSSNSNKHCRAGFE